MRKLMPYMGAALSALAMAWSAPSHAQDQFKDLDPKHWAYEAVTELQQKGILIGYPDGYFKGKRTLTRYEFAIALKRALDKIGTIQGPAGANGAAGAPGPQGEQGPPGMTPEEVANLRRLTDEFRNELAALGANIRDINNRLDALARDLADLRSRFDKMLKWSGSLFVGAETTRSRSPFVDYSGAVRGVSASIVGTADVIHSAELIGSANLPNGAKAVIDLAATNYLSYRGDTLASAPQALSAAGGALQESVVPLQANVMIPLGGAKSNSVLTVGRYEMEGTALTYSKPSLDAYFKVPGFDDGGYIQDGFKFHTKVGSVGLGIWAASYATVTDSTGGGAFNAPLFGGGPGGTLKGLPFGIDVLGNQQLANQAAGVHLTLPVFGIGEFGLGGIILSGSPAAGSGFTYSDEAVYDVTLKLTSLGKLMAYAEAAKSVTSNGLNYGDPSISNQDNNAYTLHLGYASGPLDVKLGYNYIDPNYGAPGDWMKLGSWWNPTDLEGGFLKLKYKISNALAVSVGGDLLEGARNRPGYILIGDRVNRAAAGVAYKVNNTWSLTADYEGVFYDLSTSASNGTLAGTKPNEQFITLGTGITLAKETVLKLGYQMISYNSAAGGTSVLLSGAPAGLGSDSTGLVGTTSNAGVFTTSLSVKF